MISEYKEVLYASVEDVVIQLVVKKSLLEICIFQPQNLVMMGSFPECNVKLCDFEISRVVLEGAEVREILGTPDYVGKEKWMSFGGKTT
jgi:hypothetical protein